MKNWWYYHKWYVIIGAILLGVAIDLIGSALGLFTKAPDLQIAYVGKTPLSHKMKKTLIHMVYRLSECMRSLPYVWN